ncbi:MAG: S8 family serine peptidase, partial [Gemmatimonadetes bacterium]|nr:S8 family serine peptidase [Gemmatimonadota bacterium]
MDAGRGALGPGGVTLNTVAADEEIVPGQIIVRFRPGAARSEIAEQHRAHKKKDMLLERTEIMEVPVGQEAEIAAQLSRHPNVEFAEPDRIAKLGPCEVSTACNLPDGQFFHYKWDLHNTGAVLTQATGKADADIDWSETFDYLGGNSFTGEAVIGVLDTGIRPTHQAFAGKILGGRRFLNDGIATTNYIDDHSHGTHVAGIAAAAGDNDAGVAGVDWGVKVMPVKVLDDTGDGSEFDVMEG